MKKICLYLTLCMTMALSMGCAGVETETAQQTEQQPEAIENEQIEQVEIDKTEDIKEKADKKKADKKKALEDEAKLREKKYKYEQNEAYKMFYGTWEYTEVVSQYRKLCGDEGYEELIGTRVSYYPTAYRCNKVFVPNPTYLMSIFPQDPNGYNLFLVDQINLTELLPDADYFVWVEIVDKPGTNEGEYLGSEFFLKDDNTIYAFDYNCIYELKRVGYIDDTTDTELVLGGEKNPEEREYHVYRQKDAYKLFYGTWEFTSVVAGEKCLAEDNESDELIGTQVKYLPEKYRWNKNSINYPNYIISMIPQTADSDDPNFEDWMQYDMKELIPDEPYYIGVQIANKPEDTEGVYMGTKFFLKDDNTMYALEDDCIYELKRVEYIEGYDPYDIISYHEKF